jgi:large subunit ribosomal protein LX
MSQRFEVKGTFFVGREWRPYTKVVEASNQNQAIERVYTILGSKHRLKRNLITIGDITLLGGE